MRDVSSFVKRALSRRDFAGVSGVRGVVVCGSVWPP